VRLRKLLRIARWEVSKNAGELDRRTLALIVAVLALVAVAIPFVALGGIGLDDGLYHVAVNESSPYHEVLENDSTFVITGNTGGVSANDSSVDLVLRERNNRTVAERAITQKGEAALEEFENSIRQFNDRRLRAEANQTAAFPIEVVLDFQQRSTVAEAIESGELNETTGIDESGNESAENATNATDDDSTLGEFGAPLANEALSGSPSEIDPPFPFQSLVLALLFIIPLNFFIQAYGGTMLSERINRRGELLLVSPVSRFDIIGGKTLPYFIGAMIIESVLAVGLFAAVRGEIGGLLSIAAVTPIVVLFLGLTFLGAMFARSFKELTFVTLAITVVLIAYAFVPAIFTDLNEIALISPLTLVVRDLQAETITIQEFVFSTTPPMLVGGLCFLLGRSLYREEDMFAQRSVSGRILDSLAGPITSRWHVGAMTAGLIPFVFVAQLLTIALLFVVGDTSLVLLLVVVVVTEEIAKSLHIYAAYEHGRFERTSLVALTLGIASGVGFFVGEKLALLAQLVGLPELPIGQAGLLGGVLVGPVVLLFLLAPLALHVVTAAISALGASRGKRPYVVAVVVAMVIHLAYNLTVVTLFV
jgi:ABC-type Na+ efflux pump permease subunit